MDFSEKEMTLSERKLHTKLLRLNRTLKHLVITIGILFVITAIIALALILGKSAVCLSEFRSLKNQRIAYQQLMKLNNNNE